MLMPRSRSTRRAGSGSEELERLIARSPCPFHAYTAILVTDTAGSCEQGIVVSETLMRRNIGLRRDHALHMNAFCASHNLRRAARLVTRHYDRALRPTGITAAQMPILAAISA